MANTDLTYGFKPWGPVLSKFPYRVPGDDNAPLLINDVVGWSTDENGYVTAAAAGATSIIGVNLSFVTGGVTATAMVANDPDQLLQCQNNSATSSLADIGLTADHVYAIGKIDRKVSGSELNGQVTMVPAAGGFTLQDFVNRSGNAVGANAEVIVSHTTEHARRVATGW